MKTFICWYYILDPRTFRKSKKTSIISASSINEAWLILDKHPELVIKISEL